MQELAEQPATIAALLRQRTAHRHHRLEAMLRLDADITLSRYASVLAGFAHFWRTWEPILVAVLPEDLTGWFLQRSRRTMVEADLRYLKTMPGLPASSWDDADWPELKLCLPSEAAAFGSLYVLEGSALGGQLISRRLQAMGLSPDGGGAYFHGWGERTGAMWQEFRGLLAQRVGESAHEAACQAAVDTFDGLIDLFKAHSHEPALR